MRVDLEELEVYRTAMARGLLIPVRYGVDLADNRTTTAFIRQQTTARCFYLTAQGDCCVPDSTSAMPTHTAVYNSDHVPWFVGL